MSQSHSLHSIFSQVDVSAGSCNRSSTGTAVEHSELLRDVLSAQDRTNELLEELLGVMATQQKQRAQELHQWRNANPHLAEACRSAAEALSRVQVEYLERMTEEINDTAEDLVEGEFMLNEFVDRFGPRLAHLNGVIQVLAQLSSTPAPANQADSV
jgi:mannose/cellobiose epimerase-like protein (N-acyl-D-glucosamine 2-epimerase family)